MKKIGSFIIMNLGCILLSMGVYFFKIPNGFATGGVTGIATLLAPITPISAGVWIWMLNVGLLLLGLFIKAFLVDSVIESLNSYKYFVVITNKRDEISQYILKTLHHGVTVNTAVGEFTKEPKIMIHTVCKRIEAIRLRNEIKRIDPHAFMIITTSSEIIGRGFRSV